MTKFEEHDGLIFKMLEEHEIVPLKENDANVLVRFITHGVIGEYVMEHWLDCNQKNVPIYVENVDSDGDVTVCIENGNEHHCCPFPMFEIIGYPVADGSKEWALYQMMQGKMVCHETSPWDWYRMYSDHAIQNRTVGYMDRVSAWLESTVQSGWQIYTEPKPESQYKGYGIKDLKPDNLYLNIKPLNPADWCFDKKNLLVLVDDNFKGIVGENVTREQVVEIVKLLTEPAPQYKVGDWVEIESSHTKGKTFVSVIKEMPNQEHRTVHVNSYCGGYYEIRESQIVRKLKPSEVIVNIGCLSGTVEKAYGEKKGTFILSGLSGQRNVLWLSMLGSKTRKLVEGLLKAQEEEK